MNFELQNSSKHSSSSYQNEQTIIDVDNQQLPLRNIQNLAPTKCPNPKKLFKVVFLVFIVFTLFWMGSTFLSDNFIKGRTPKRLASKSQIIELVSPDEFDYRSFYFYKKIVETALDNIRENKISQDEIEEVKPFINITFGETYNIFKVIKTIQLAKDYTTSKQEEQQIYHPPEQLNIRKAVNYTQFFPPVVDQFRCASCYTFPVAATIEYLYKQKKNLDIKLSEQQLIDCGKQDPEANGCEDGNITKVFQYARDIGMIKDQLYPYRSLKGQSFPCNNSLIQKKQTKKFKISGFKQLPYRNCEAIQQQLVKGNVVAAMINIGSLSSYTGGTFKDCKRSDYNHAITIVGQTQKGQWIIRNSWGQNWGHNGYFKLARGNTCGVCDFGFVPYLQFDQNGGVKKIDEKDYQTSNQGIKQ